MKNPGRLCVRCLVNEENDLGRPTAKIDQVREVLGQAWEQLNAFESAASNMLGVVVGLSRKVSSDRWFYNAMLLMRMWDRLLTFVSMSSAWLILAPSKGRCLLSQ